MRTSARATDKGGDDAFLLTVLPAITTATKRPRDIVFVVDRSGSMSGWKMIAARRAVARMVDTLRGADRFNVIAFDDNVEYPAKLGKGLVAASDRARFSAVEWLATVDDRGGTEMAQPLAEAADLLAGGDLERDRVLVFVTDGQAGNEAQILKLLGQRLKKTRVFALGIDQAVNAGFMNRLAALGASGEAELVESEDRVDEVLARCHRRIDTPALSELSISVEDGELVPDTIAPSRLPDVFDGVPAVIAGRIRRRAGKRPTIVVTGRDGDKKTQTLRIAVETSANPSLLPGWARLHLRDLEDRFDGHQGDRQQLQASILRVSLEAKVLCRFTAFIAVDHEVVNEGGRLHKATQAVESPAGWGRAEEPMMDSMSASPSMPAPPPSPSPMRRGGAPGAGGFGSAGPQTSKSSAAFSAPRMRSAMPVDEESDEITGEFAIPSAASISAEGGIGGAMAPAPEQQKEEAERDSFVDRARRAVFGDAKKKAAPPSPPKPSPPKPSPHKDLEAKGQATPQGQLQSLVTSGLDAYVARLTALLAKLDSDGAAAIDDVVDALRLLLEEMAHAGVPPATRAPVQKALDALVLRDVAGAQASLRTVVPARSTSFWGA